MENTDILATTIHNAFDLDFDLKTKLDLSSMENKKVKKLHETDLLCLDEISMMVRRRINMFRILYQTHMWYNVCEMCFLIPRM